MAGGGHTLSRHEQPALQATRHTYEKHTLSCDICWLNDLEVKGCSGTSLPATCGAAWLQPLVPGSVVISGSGFVVHQRRAQVADHNVRDVLGRNTLPYVIIDLDSNFIFCHAIPL